MNAEQKFTEFTERLTRRHNHLSKRVASSTAHLSYDEAELSALRWVLAYLHDNQAQAVDHIEEYLRS